MFRGSVATFGVRLISGGFRYGLGILIARTAGTAAFGEFSVGTALLLLLATLAAGGAITGVVRFGSTELERAGKGAVGDLLRRERNRTWRRGLILSAGWIALGYFAPGIPGSAGSFLTFAGMAASLPFLAVSNVLEAGSRCTGSPRYELLLRCALQPVMFLALLGGGHELLPAVPPLALIWGAYAISLAVELMAAEQIVFRLFPPAPLLSSPPGPRLGSHFAYEILVVAAASADLWLIGLLGGPIDAGCYAAALRTAEIVIVLRGSYQAFLVPAVTKILARRASGNPEAAGQFDRLAAGAGRGATLASAAVAIPLVLGAAEILGLFRGEIVRARSALALLVVVPVVLSYGLSASAVLLARAPGTLARIRLVEVLATVAGVALLFPRFGLEGAAAAVGLAALIQTALSVRAAHECRSFLTLQGWSRALAPLALAAAAAWLARGSVSLDVPIARTLEAIVAGEGALLAGAFFFWKKAL